MGDAGFFRGTSADQDVRFSNKEKKLLQQLKSKFPPEFETPVDMTKVNLDVIKPWITDRVTELIGIEDEVVIDFIFNMLETDQAPDPCKMQINLTGFLESKTKVFMKELWSLFISAQSNPHGIPQEFLDKKKEELRKKKEEGEQISSGLQRKQASEVVDEVRRKMLHSQVMAKATMTLMAASAGIPVAANAANNPLMTALHEHQKQKLQDGSGTDAMDIDRDRGYRDREERGRDNRDREERGYGRNRTHSGERRHHRSRDRMLSRSASPREESPKKRSPSPSQSPSPRRHKSHRAHSRSRSMSRSHSPQHTSRRHKHRRGHGHSPSRRNRAGDSRRGSRKSSGKTGSSGDETKETAVPSRWDREESVPKEGEAN